MKFYELQRNPIKITGSMGSKKTDEMMIWTAEEFDSFISCVENKFTSVTMFNILFWTGIRSGELLALTGEDFNFEKKELSITKTYSRIKGVDYINPPKTPKGNRVIMLDDELCDFVKRYISMIYDYNSSQRLFTVTKHYLKHEMQRGCKKSGIEEIRVHDLRHSHVSFLIEQNFSPLLISERVGHEDIQTTLQTYSHLYPNKQSEVVVAIENFKKKKKK